MSSPQTATAEGNLDRYPFPRLLYYLYKKAFVGRLEVRPGGSAPLQMYFRDGLPCHCDLKSESDLLGQVLLERGLISMEHYHQSLHEATRGGRLQGQILLEIGALDQRQLVEGLRLQLRRKVYRFFGFSDAAFSLFTGEHSHGLEGEAAYVRVDPLFVIYQGVRNTFDSPRLMGELERLDGMTIELRPDFDKVRERYGFTDEVSGVVELLLRSRLPIDRLFAVSDLGPIETQMLIYTLWVTEVLIAKPADDADRLAAVAQPASPLPGRQPTTPLAQTGPMPAMRSAHGPLSGEVQTDSGAQPTVRSRPNAVRARPTTNPQQPKMATSAGETKTSAEVLKTKKDVEEAHQKMKDQNHYEILGLKRGAKNDEIRDAYFELAKRYHPDRIASLKIDGLDVKAAEVFRQINEAHSVLTDAEKRRKYEDKLDGKADENEETRKIIEAEVCFQKGVVLFRKKNFGEARKEFERSFVLNEKEGEHLAWFAWTRYSDPKTDQAKELPKIKADLLQAINLSPKNATCHYYLGEVYLALDEVGRAKTCFNRVLELDPKHIGAQRQLRLMNMRGGGGGKGKKSKSLFGKFLKK